jgi:hypothetical protein
MLVGMAQPEEELILVAEEEEPEPRAPAVMLQLRLPDHLEQEPHWMAEMAEQVLVAAQMGMVETHMGEEEVDLVQTVPRIEQGDPVQEVW